MPIPLPDGITPKRRTRTDDEVLTAGTRSARWRFEVLDNNEVLLGNLDGVDAGGSVEFTASASVKGAGQISLDDADQDIDWLNVRIRPVCVIEGLSREVPVGIWLPSAPVENWTDLGRSWNVKLLDKATILDVDVWTNPTSGNAETYVAPKGSNVISLVRALITQTGEDIPAIEVAPDGPTLSQDMVFEAGTSRLKIINDMLDAAGFFSLAADYAGQFRVTPYNRPADRAPVYPNADPFIVGPTSVWHPEFVNDRDNADVPNKYICIGQGDGTTAALTSIATNTNPDSPFSYLRRGRWIPRVETEVEAVNQAALDLITQRKLDSATAISSKLDVSHPFLPDLQFNTVVPVRNPRAGIDQLCTVTKTTVTFDPLALCNSRMQEVVS